MKKILFAAAAAIILSATSAFGQVSIDLTGGISALSSPAGLRVGPAAGVAVDGTITPWLSLGAQAAIMRPGTGTPTATWNFCDADADIYIRSDFGMRTKVRPFVKAGLGGNIRWQNMSADFDAAKQWNTAHGDAKGVYCVPCSVISLSGLAGAGAQFVISENISIIAELDYRLASDQFNGLKEGGPDHLLTASAGVRFSLGSKPSAQTNTVIEVVRPDTEALARMQARIDSLAAANAETEARLAEALAMAEGLRDSDNEKARYAKALLVEALNANRVFFIIDTWEIRPGEMAKVEAAARIMKLAARYGYSFSATGLADKETGNAQRNLFLSQKRAEVVSKALASAGVTNLRDVTWKGDTEAVDTIPERNRTVYYTLYE